MYSCLFPACALNFSSVCDVFVRCLDEKITFKVRLLVLTLKERGIQIFMSAGKFPACALSFSSVCDVPVCFLDL